MHKITFSCFFLLLILFSCDSTKIDSGSQTPADNYKSLIGKTYVVQNYSAADNNSKYELSFLREMLSLKLDKNTCKTTYSIENKELNINNPFNCTKVCCDGKNGQQLLQDLQGKLNIIREGTTVILRNPNGKTIELAEIKNTSSNDLTATVPELLKDNWEIIAIGDQDLTSQYGVAFNNNQIVLQLNVNSCSINALYSADKIAAQVRGACTEACCDSEQSNKVLSFFNQPLNYTITDPTDPNKVRLTCDNGQIKVVLKRPTPKRMSIVNTKWSSVSFGMGANMKKIGDYKVEFKEGQIKFKLDVNNCTVNYTNDKGQYTVTSKGPACTRACCDSEESTKFRDALIGKDIKYEISQEGQKLVITKGENVVQLRKWDGQ
ncbi:MAG: hypothetical protein MK212_12825 [Saprospiraceae bacterium]|nr:hypothetical protein [Saprospiraceae bacterium]